MHSFALAFVSIIIFAALSIAQGASHAEGDDMTHGIRSPVGRHHLESIEHLYLFYAHDFFAFSSLFLFAVLWNMKKSNPLHKWIGRFLIIPLVGAIVTGFKLIAFRTSDSYVHIHAIQLGRVTISTQGYCVIGICINAFVYLRWIEESWLNKSLLILHGFNVYMGLRSFQFLLSTYMRWNDYEANDANREVAFELLFALTLPQLILDISYFIVHLSLSRKPELRSTIQWYEFHEMSAMGLIYICAIGLFFNIAHDAYYIFRSPGITDLRIRMIIIMAPFCFNCVFYRRKISSSVHNLLTLAADSFWAKETPLPLPKEKSTNSAESSLTSDTSETVKEEEGDSFVEEPPVSIVVN